MDVDDYDLCKELVRFLSSIDSKCTKCMYYRRMAFDIYLLQIRVKRCKKRCASSRRV